MARRQNEGGVILLLAILGGIGWLLNKGAESFSGVNVANVFVVAAFGLMAFLSLVLLRRWLAERKAKRIQQSLLKKVYVATQGHLAALTRKRMQLVQPDAYGNQKLEKWTEEIRYFLFDHLGPSLSLEEQNILPENFEPLRLTIDHVIQDAMREHPSFRSFSDNMSPVEFEGFCAEELRQAGWDARVTLQSRDQGVDVIAEKNNFRVVLQCKLYTGPVGNKAVQEAAAGRAHENADYGIVVTNNRYTSAAEQLATTNGVFLLHYRDLRNLDAMLPPPITSHAPPVLVGRREPLMNSSAPILTPNFDRARWDALLKRDPQLGMVVDKLRPLGQKWVDKFAVSYLATNDRSHLPTLVSKIIAEARKEFEKGDSLR
jgi:HJR/Mrr/RecB family endonuclease